MKVQIIFEYFDIPSSSYNFCYDDFIKIDVKSKSHKRNWQLCGFTSGGSYKLDIPPVSEQSNIKFNFKSGKDSVTGQGLQFKIQARPQ